MIANTLPSRTIHRAAPWRPSRPQPLGRFGEELVDELDANPAGDAADTLRMIELSGMIGFAPGLIEAD